MRLDVGGHLQAGALRELAVMTTSEILKELGTIVADCDAAKQCQTRGHHETVRMWLDVIAQRATDTFARIAKEQP